MKERSLVRRVKISEEGLKHEASLGRETKWKNETNEKVN
jgi:hypothetical protein